MWNLSPDIVEMRYQHSCERVLNTVNYLLAERSRLKQPTKKPQLNKLLSPKSPRSPLEKDGVKKTDSVTSIKNYFIGVIEDNNKDFALSQLKEPDSKKMFVTSPSSKVAFHVLQGSEPKPDADRTEELKRHMGKTVRQMEN